MNGCVHHLRGKHEFCLTKDSTHAVDHVLAVSQQLVNASAPPVSHLSHKAITEIASGMSCEIIAAKIFEDA